DPQVLGPRLGFGLDGSGRLVAFDPATGAASIAFTPVGAAITAFYALAGPGGSTQVFVAEDDGSVALLGGAPNQALREKRTLDGVLPEPAGVLDALRTTGGGIDVYLTLLDSTQPIVLTFP